MTFPPKSITLEDLAPYREFMNDRELTRYNDYLNNKPLSAPFIEEDLKDFERRKRMVEDADRGSSNKPA